MTAAGAFPVTESSQVAAARRAVLWLAEQQQFGDERSGRAAIIVTELATNLLKHARGGEILLRVLTSSTGEPEQRWVLDVWLARPRSRCDRASGRRLRPLYATERHVHRRRGVPRFGTALSAIRGAV